METRGQTVDLSGWSRAMQEGMRSSGATKPPSSAVVAAPVRSEREGDWEYRLVSDDSQGSHAVITGYRGSKTHLVVPEFLGGVSVSGVAPQAFAHCRVSFEGVEVSAGNAFFSTDGIALFDKRAETLLKALVAVESYKVPDGCVSIAPAAFKGMSSLRKLEFDEGLEEIGSYAFFRTSLERVVCPPSLRAIGEKAFASTRLNEVGLNEGLQAIGDQAFSGTKIGKALLPATLEHLGTKAFWNSEIDFNDPGAFAVADGNASLCIDSAALYKRTAEGLSLVECLGRADIFETLPETVEICPRAFEGSCSLESVFLNKGLRVVGDRSFASCEKLWRVVLPWTIESIGDEAFFLTQLSEVRVGPDVSHIGSRAFEFAGEVRTARKRKLSSISVAPQNEHYYERDGMLIERGVNGDRVLLYAGSPLCVHIPDSVVEVADMAFYNAQLEQLDIPASLQRVSQRGFLGCDGLKEVRISFPDEVQGCRQISVPFPEHPRDRWDFSRCLAMGKRGLFFDFEIYDAYAVHELDTACVVKMALARLTNPIELSQASRMNYESAVLRYLPSALVSFEERSDSGAINALLGYASKTKAVMEELLRLGSEAQDRSLREIALRLTEEW